MRERGNRGSKLRIGKIGFTNLFPIFYMLQSICDCSEYEFVEGVPSYLNRAIRNGDIHISPSSSIEFLRHPEKYRRIENHSVSSAGPVRSILLLSRLPLTELNGLTLLTSSQSETSVALLSIILKKFYALHCNLESSGEPVKQASSDHAACMLIGDEALREARKSPDFFLYDLGELWYRHTGLPFTFALWIARKDCCIGKEELIDTFTRKLDIAKSAALKNLKALAAVAPIRNLLSEDELVSYWKGISYDFGDLHRRGLELFGKYALELGLI